MKLQTIVLIGAGLFLVYKLGKRINGNEQPKLVKNPDAAVLTQGIPESENSGGIGKTESGMDIMVIAQNPNPVSRSIFPEAVFQQYAVKDAAESVKTYEESPN